MSANTSTKNVIAGTTVFPLEITEYERGWGSRHDGYLLFLSEDDRIKFLRNDAQEKRKNSQVPDYYLAFTSIPTRPLLKDTEFIEREFGADKIYVLWT